MDKALYYAVAALFVAAALWDVQAGWTYVVRYGPARRREEPVRFWLNVTFKVGMAATLAVAAFLA